LAAVWGASSSNVWAVGDGVIIHWNGSSWTVTPGGETAYLYAVWGANAGSVWAAGAYGALGKWNGTSWSGFYGSFAGDAGYQSTSDAYVGLWGSSAKDVWAIGESANILHFDGATWTVQPGPSQYKNFSTQGCCTPLRGIWGDATDDVWVVGSAGSILHWDGSSWNQLVAP